VIASIRRRLPSWRSPAVRRRALVAGVVLVLAGIAFLVALGSRPIVRVVNATTVPVLVVIDGRTKVRVPPTSLETAFAGEILRPWPGTHTLAVTPEGGAPGEPIRALLSAYTSYLYAPASDDQCFWVERTVYGRAKASGPRLRALPPDQRVWVVPDRVDVWFAPSPLPGDDRWSSGAERVAVRQVRCGSEP
jgi:hypothetical protein